MAEKKKRRVVKPAATMREKIEKADAPKKRRIRESVSAASSSRIGKVKDFGRREYHPIKLPDNRVGRVLGKQGRIFPRFFSEAWAELRQVTWPNRKETIKLTTAVLVFAIVFGGLIAIVDLGLEKFFRNVVLK